MANPYLDAIDWGTQLPSLTVTYYFKETPALYNSLIGQVGLNAWYPYEKQQAEKALATFETFTNLNFVEVSNQASADIVLMQTSNQYMGTGVLGVGAPPGTFREGEVLFNWQGLGWDETNPGKGGLEKGGYGFVTMIHELGHALGLAHPHDTGGTSTVFPGVTPDDYSDLGDYNLNQGIYTMMSYNDGWWTSPNGRAKGGAAYGFEGTPMAFDIAALQAKYGANMSYRTGDDTYTLKACNGVGTYYSSIWDAGGSDTIAFGGKANAVIDLRAATLLPGWLAGGAVSYVAGIKGGFTIANGVTIENARSGAGNDVLNGNDAANLLAGGRGKDILRGFDGGDRLSGSFGKDTMLGGGAADVFVFSKVAMSLPGLERDLIKDFSGTDGDLIDFRAIDALPGGIDDAFVFIASATFAAYKALNPGSYGMVRVGGAIVQVDVGGNNTVDMEIKVIGTVLTAADFLL